MSVVTAGEMVDLAINIRALRLKRNWSQRELARRIGSSHPNIVRYEKPACDSIKIKTLARLADAFEVRMADLLTAPEEVNK